MNTPHSKAKLTAQSRAEMIGHIIDLRQPVAQVAAGVGISERCAYRSLARFCAEGATGLHDRSSCPKCSSRTTHPFRVAHARSQVPSFQFSREDALAIECTSEPYKAALEAWL